MKLDINKIELTKSTDNISQILHNNEVLRFWSPKIKVPFGIDNEYGKYIMRLELNERDKNIVESEHIYFKKVILHIENLLKKKLNIDDIEFKSVLRKRKDLNELLEFRIKNFKNNILTTIEYEDKDNNYLKGVLDIEKQCYVKVQIEIYALWDYRERESEKKEQNKVGLICYINKIIVLK